MELSLRGKKKKKKDRKNSNFSFDFIIEFNHDIFVIRSRQDPGDKLSSNVQT